MATHGWTNEAASQLYYPRGDITYETTPPTRTYTTPTSLTTSRNASIVQDTSDFAADLVHESVVAFEPRHPSIYYSSHVAIGGSTGIWSGTGAYPASPDVLAQTEALSDVAPKYADWLAFGGDIARAQEGVTLLNAYEPMCCFGQASGGVSAHRGDFGNQNTGVGTVPPSSPRNKIVFGISMHIGVLSSSDAPAANGSPPNQT
ncbi:hypothetical protein PC9H_004322 [Pleurotus ostreatus]|uniref:Uncharacterized protein n=1 Tax=Pleurotus ostreatus TaxID=5322 RepID=A0A8H7DYU3_PLEOS|nr:uncharacterized protein PC9H_004322 [Pleurotus ostreatus]KAF7437481.1 hypothetical protein PC9H_004322 [Pleurotus ostreatus]